MIRGRGPTQAHAATARTGTTMCSSLSATQSAPVRSSSGRSRKKCTSPVTVMPTSPASRTTRQPGWSAAGSRARTVEEIATRMLLWIVK